MTLLTLSRRIQTLMKAVSLLLLHIGLGNCHDFHRNTTGVSFSVYVHNSYNITEDWVWTNYTLEDVKTMVKVVSSRFSKIATHTVGSGADRNAFQKNYTYYRSYSQVFAAEAAALVNREMAGKPEKISDWNPLQVYVGIHVHPNPYQLEMEIELAKESAEKANSKFQDTVKAFIFSHEDLSEDVTVSKRVLLHLEKLRAPSLGSDLRSLKLGTRQRCEEFERKNTDSPSELAQVLMKIINQIDFVICIENPQTGLQTRDAFTGVKNRFLKYKHDLKALNPNIEVMGETGWPGRIAHSWEVEQMQEYWQTADEWAAQNNFTVWMLEAFNNPWKKDEDRSDHYGWWKLTEDSKTGMVDGYIEKAHIIQKESHGSSGTTEIPSQTTKMSRSPKKHESRSGIEKKSGVGKESCGLTSALGILVVISLRLIFLNQA